MLPLLILCVFLAVMVVSFTCAASGPLPEMPATPRIAEGNWIQYDGVVHRIIKKSLEWHYGRHEEVTIVTLDDGTGERQVTLEELEGCPIWPAENPPSFK